jgi:hypothetical protein
MTDHREVFRQAVRQMEAHRTGQEKSFLRVVFLHQGRVVEERVLETKYGCRRMEAWTARGPEYTVRNAPVELLRFGVGAGLSAGKRRSTATRWLTRKAA